MPNVDPHHADPNRNKTLQLLELFSWSHQAAKFVISFQNTGARPFGGLSSSA